MGKASKSILFYPSQIGVRMHR